MPNCHRERGGESLHLVLGLRPRRSGCLNHNSSEHNRGHTRPFLGGPDWDGDLRPRGRLIMGLGQYGYKYKYI